MYKIVKRFFDRKIYTEDDVKKFVTSGKITMEQFREITGTEYIS